MEQGFLLVFVLTVFKFKWDGRNHGGIVGGPQRNIGASGNVCTLPSQVHTLSKPDSGPVQYPSIQSNAPISAMRCVYLFISTRNGSRFEKEFFQVSFFVCSFPVRTMMTIVHFFELVKFLKPQQKIRVS